MTHPVPQIDPAQPLLFVINGASGSADAQVKGEAIEAALAASGRRGELLFCEPGELAGVARAEAARALASHTALVAVGGDGTLNAVAQAAHAAGCAMGVVAQGTFNYFARTHGLSSDPAQAVAGLLTSVPTPVQVAAVNEQVFLVNASLGLYPDLLEDRERYKARFGRSRWVALGAACATLLGAQRKLRLQITQGSQVRSVSALTLFVGNNRLQLTQIGMQPEGVSREGQVTAVMLPPVGLPTMVRLMAQGAMGTLGEAQDVERFEFHRMLVKPSLGRAGGRLKVAFDGEVSWMRAPLEFKVLEQPLFLMKPAPTQGSDAQGAGVE